MEFISLWDEAAGDLEAENTERAQHLASQASAGIWQFLAAAKSEPEFETRLALAEGNISTVAAESGTSVADIEAIMRRRFALLLEASDNPFAKDDDSDDDSDDDGDSDDSGSDSDDDGDDDDSDDSSDSDDDDSDGDDSDSDDDGDDSGDDDSDDSSDDDDSGNPFGKEGKRKCRNCTNGNHTGTNGTPGCIGKNCGCTAQGCGKQARPDTGGLSEETYWATQGKESSLDRIAALKAQIEAGVSPLDPEFGKLAWGAVIKAVAPMVIGEIAGKGKSEGSDDDGEPEGVLEEGSEASRLPFVEAEGHTANGSCPSCGSDEDIVGIPNAGIPNTVKWACQGCGYEGKVESFQNAKNHEVFAALTVTAQQCEYCGKYGHDYTVHPDAVAESERAARQEQIDADPDSYTFAPGRYSEYHEGSKTAGRPGTCDNCGSENVTMQGYHAPYGTGPGGRGRMGDPGGGQTTECKDCGHKTDYPSKRASKTAERMGLPWYHQQHHMSAECKPGGSGQCDGYDYDSGNRPCDCYCHDADDLPGTIEGVKDWHDDYHGIEKDSSLRATAEIAKSYDRNGVTVHEFGSTGEAYNESQTNDKISDGDVLSVPSENVHGYLHQAWPIATHHDGDPGEFHTPKADDNGDTSESLNAMLSEDPKYPAAHEVAGQLHAANPTKGPKPVDQHHLDALDKRFEYSEGKPKWHPDKPDTIIHSPNNTWDGPTHVKVNEDGTYTFHGYQGKETFGADGQTISREGSKTASEEPGDFEYGGRFRQPETLDIPNQYGHIPFHTPREVDPDHSPDAGQVHITDHKNMANGRHNVMVIDANGNSQWPIRYDNGSLGFDNPHSIVTPHHVIHDAMDHAEELDRTLGTTKRSSKTAGGAGSASTMDFSPTTDTGNIPQMPTGYAGGKDPNQSSTKPRQMPSGGAGGIAGPAGPQGPGGDLGPGSPSDDSMDFNPTSNGGDVKQGMGDYPDSKMAKIGDYVVTQEQARRVAELVAESASGLNFQERPVADGPLTQMVVQKATEMGDNLEKKLKPEHEDDEGTTASLNDLPLLLG